MEVHSIADVLAVAAVIVVLLAASISVACGDSSKEYKRIQAKTMLLLAIIALALFFSAVCFEIGYVIIYFIYGP